MSIGQVEGAMFKVVPEAGEAVIVLPFADPAWVVRDPVTDERVELPRKYRRGIAVLRAELTSAERAQKKAQRAKTNCRRWAKANRLKHLWTFTYAEPCREWAQLVRDVTGFMKHLSKVVYPKFGKMPLLIVAEPHPGGRGWHIHVGSPRYVHWKYIVPGWRHGLCFFGASKDRPFVDRRGRTTVAKCSRYLAKYVAKGLGAEDMPGVEVPPLGRHRYWVTQGFKPEAYSVRCDSREEASAMLARFFGEDPDGVFASRVLKGWEGPPCWWLRWPESACAPAPKWAGVKKGS